MSPARDNGRAGLYLGLAALFALACSFDDSKLRAPGAKVGDAATALDGKPSFDTTTRLDGATPPDGDAAAGGSDDGPRNLDSLADVVALGDGAPILDLDGTTELDLGGSTGGIDGSGNAGTGGTGGGPGGTGGLGFVDASSDDQANSSADTSSVVSSDAASDSPLDAAADTSTLPDGPPGDPLPEVVSSTPDPDLVLWYRFDETSGTVAHDSALWGGVAHDATLAGTMGPTTLSFSTKAQVGTHALLFPPPGPGGGGYVILPRLDALAPDAITIAVWVRLEVAGPAQNWERIFDFGDSSTGPRWFNLAARSGTGPFAPVFAMSNVGHAAADKQEIDGTSAMTAAVWHHIAVVLPSGALYTGVMYIDGAVAGSNGAMTLHLSDIGATTNNWLGRSEFPADPTFNGSMDDFRIYKRALSPAELAALMAIR